MASDPWKYWTAAQVGQIIGLPPANIQKNWPLIVAQLDNVGGMEDRAVWEGAVAHVRVETGGNPDFGFTPVREAYWLSEDWRRTNLSYYPKYGRGFLQCTGGNYDKYPDRMDVVWNAGGALARILKADLDSWMQADNSALFLACYFRDHGGDNLYRIPKAMRAGNHRESRRLVQGADAGLAEYTRYAESLAALNRTDPPIPIPVTPARYVFPVVGYSGVVNLHWGTHPGATDIFALRGTPVVAIADGVVVFREEWSNLGGNCLQIEHTNGDNLDSYYAHGNGPPTPRMGQNVKAGDHLFGVGDSGNAATAGPHLHFGMGQDILTGTGPAGGAGSNFDAVALLRQIQGQTASPPLSTDQLRIKELEALVTDKDNRLRTAISHLGYVRGDVANKVSGISTDLQGVAEMLRSLTLPE